MSTNGGKERGRGTKQELEQADGRSYVKKMGSLGWPKNMRMRLNASIKATAILLLCGFPLNHLKRSSSSQVVEGMTVTASQGKGRRPQPRFCEPPFEILSSGGDQGLAVDPPEPP